MIAGIGTDIVCIARMAKNIQRYGVRFAERILHPDEYAEFQTTTRQAHFLAKRFAAKEAAAKAMGTGFRDGVNLKDIYVKHDSYGKPVLQFAGHSALILTQTAVCAWHLSLSDEDDYAVAFVVLEKK